MVGRLFSAYPKTDYDDPKTALAMMVHVLSGYPLRIVDQLTNLTTGMQLKYKFPPRLAEIKTEAEAVIAAERAVEEQRNRRRAERERIEKQIEERVALDRARPDRPTVADLKAKYGPTYGIDPDGGDRKPVENNFKAPTWDELRDYYAANPDRISHLTGPSGTRTK